jgi:trehalose 6-phosphate phosphatase
VSESSRRAGASLSAAIELARTALADAPAGVLADFDGTLAPIVTDPALARPVAGVAASLERLASGGVIVAIITGRAPLDARAMLGATGVLIVGNHGTEWLEPGSETTTTRLDSAAVRAGLAEALDRLPRIAGVPVEDKGLSASVHYRNAADPEAARAAILDGLGDVRELGLDLRHGRMSVELRPVLAGDKGTAAREVVARHGLRGAVVLGDDVTDLDMFRALADLREAGTVRVAVIGVGGGGGEVPASVADAADIVLSGPEQAAALLDALS